MSPMSMWTLAVRVVGIDASAEALKVAHLRFDYAVDVVSRPSLPEGSATVPSGPQSFVSGNCSYAVSILRTTILGDRVDWDRVAC